jgi:hypothetical protein
MQHIFFPLLYRERGIKLSSQHVFEEDYPKPASLDHHPPRCVEFYERRMGPSGKSLAAGAMYAVNRTIRDLLFNACIPEGEVLNYINLAISVTIPYYR